MVSLVCLLSCRALRRLREREQPSGGGTQGADDRGQAAFPESFFLENHDAIGSTTFPEYQASLEHDRALGRRFQKIDVREPSIEGRRCRS